MSFSHVLQQHAMYCCIASKTSELQCMKKQQRCQFCDVFFIKRIQSVRRQS